DQFESFYVVLRLALYDRKRFLQFLIVGGTGFIMQFITVYAAVNIGIAQFVAAMLGGEIAILWNFFANNTWTFKDTKSVKTQGSFLFRLVKFNFASLASIGVQGAVVYIAVRLLGEKLRFLGFTVHTSIAILFPTIILLV